MVLVRLVNTVFIICFSFQLKEDIGIEGRTGYPIQSFCQRDRILHTTKENGLFCTVLLKTWEQKQ